MKFSYQWLHDLVPGLSTQPTELERLITLKTAESEGIETVGGHFESVIAVRILSAEPLPKGKNKRVIADAGRGREVTVVCGASNVQPGMLVPWVQPGAQLGGKIISRAVFEGVESEGMLASASELGINRDHTGLLPLTDLNPGDPLPRLKPDFIIEIDNKSLTHRPDLWGHFGMAREVAAITQNQLLDPVSMELLPSGSAAVQVNVADAKLCPRYSALVMSNARVEASPLWLQTRLESVGLNAISNIVDVTNYVLAELPQPMHAFDADKIIGGAIFVRLAQAGEKLAALNGETYELTAADLVIADASGPIALAGVIGGAGSAISETTTRIILESANFNPTSVRLSSARHKLRTDASMRFEKSLDPENTLRGIARAVQLLDKISPGITADGGVADVYTPLPKLAPIVLPPGFIDRKLGTKLPLTTVIEILESLGFSVTADDAGTLTVTVPSWRATKDVSRKDDLVEEIGRIIGYDSIAPAPPLVASTVPPANPLRLYLRQIRNRLVAQGFTEAHNYSFVTEAAVKRFAMDIETHIAVQNPIASELTHLRRSLLPGLFQSILNNVRYQREFRLFEIGSEIHPSPAPSLPAEVPHVTAVLYSALADEQDFFELKRVAECVFPAARLTAAEPAAYEHPARTAEVHWRGKPIGRVFELHPSLFQAEGIEGRAFVLDVDLNRALAIAETDIRYIPLRKYPTSGFDLSLITGLKTPVEKIQDELIRLADKELAFLEFVRQYVGAPLQSGQKSVTYHLEVGALDHTLMADELTSIRSRVIEGMRAAGYELRGIEESKP